MVLAQRSASVDQHPQDRELLVVDHRSQPRHPGPDQRDGVGVGGVGLAALTGREHPRSGRQLRRHIDDLLAGSKQPHRDVVADPVAALDRPDPAVPVGLEPVDVTGHRGEPGLIGAEPAAAQDGLIAVHHLDRGRPSCAGPSRSRRVLLAPACTLPNSIQHLVVESGGQRYFELGRPFLSLFRPWRCPARACHVRATRDPEGSAWAAAIRATDRAPGPSLARPGPGVNATSSRCRLGPTMPLTTRRTPRPRDVERGVGRGGQGSGSVAPKWPRNSWARCRRSASGVTSRVPVWSLRNW